MHFEETEIYMYGVKVLSQISRLFRIIKLYHVRRGLVIVTSQSQISFIAWKIRKIWEASADTAATEAHYMKGYYNLEEETIKVKILAAKSSSTNETSVYRLVINADFKTAITPMQRHHLQYIFS